MKKIFFGLILLIYPCLAHALNMVEIDNIARSIARDPIPTNGTPRVSEVLVSSFINVAVQETAILTWCMDNLISTPIVNGRILYPYNTDSVAIERVTVDGTMIPGTSITQLDNNSKGTWQANLSTTTPTVFYTLNGQIGFDTILSTTYNKNIGIQYIQMPSPLVNPTDIPFNGILRYTPFHMAICYYTAALICYTDNRPTEGDRYYKFYTDRVQNMSSTIRLSPGYYPTFGANSNQH